MVGFFLATNIFFCIIYECLYECVLIVSIVYFQFSKSWHVDFHTYVSVVGIFCFSTIFKHDLVDGTLIFFYFYLPVSDLICLSFFLNNPSKGSLVSSSILTNFF